MIGEETEQQYTPYIGTLVLIDFGVYKLLEVVEYEQEPYFEVVSISNQIVKFSILSGITLMKGIIRDDVYLEMVRHWNSSSNAKAV